MGQFSPILEYLQNKTKVLQAGSLPNRDRRTCFIVQNTLLDSRDIHNHNYKTQDDLVKGVVNAINIMRTELGILFQGRHQNIILMDTVVLVDVIRDFKEYKITDYEGANEYLHDLAIVVKESINYNTINGGLEQDQILFLNTVIYLCVVAKNHLNSVTYRPLLVEGVDISFDRKRSGQVAR